MINYIFIFIKVEYVYVKIYENRNILHIGILKKETIYVINVLKRCLKVI